jgi:hypothetical protein
MEYATVVADAIAYPRGPRTHVTNLRDPRHFQVEWYLPCPNPRQYELEIRANVERDNEWRNVLSRIFTIRHCWGDGDKIGIDYSRETLRGVARLSPR